MTNAEFAGKIREAIDKYNVLPRHEQLRLQHAQKIGWVMGVLDLPGTPENYAAIDGVIRAIAEERKPRQMAVDK